MTTSITSSDPDTVLMFRTFFLKMSSIMEEIKVGEKLTVAAVDKNWSRDQ